MRVTVPPNRRKKRFTPPTRVVRGHAEQPGCWPPISRLLVSSSGRGERSEREVLVEDVLGIVGRLQLAQPGEGAAGKRVMQALRALVRLEAQVEAVQVRAKLVPVGVETAGVPANRGDVEVLVAVRVGGGIRVDVVDRA